MKPCSQQRTTSIEINTTHKKSHEEEGRKTTTGDDEFTVIYINRRKHFEQEKEKMKEKMKKNEKKASKKEELSHRWGKKYMTSTHRCSWGRAAPVPVEAVGSVSESCRETVLPSDGGVVS